MPRSNRVQIVRYGLMERTSSKNYSGECKQSSGPLSVTSMSPFCFFGHCGVGTSLQPKGAEQETEEDDFDA